MKIGFPPALTQLSDDEQLLQSTLRNFARERVAPLVYKWTKRNSSIVALLPRFLISG